MFGFLFGVIVGALGYWAYTFWKGGDDTSWDQSFSSSTGSNSYGSYSSEPVGTSTTSEGSTTPSTSP
jgi:hypothetical protein